MLRHTSQSPPVDSRSSEQGPTPTGGTTHIDVTFPEAEAERRKYEGERTKAASDALKEADEARKLAAEEAKTAKERAEINEALDFYSKFAPPEWGPHKLEEIARKAQLKLPITLAENEFSSNYTLWAKGKDYLDKAKKKAEEDKKKAEEEKKKEEEKEEGKP